MKTLCDVIKQNESEVVGIMATCISFRLFSIFSYHRWAGKPHVHLAYEHVCKAKHLLKAHKIYFKTCSRSHIFREFCWLSLALEHAQNFNFTLVLIRFLTVNTCLSPQCTNIVFFPAQWRHVNRIWVKPDTIMVYTVWVKIKYPRASKNIKNTSHNFRIIFHL